MLNPPSLELLRNEKGRGKKLLMKYDRPFEILRKLSPVTYHLWLPTLYGIHLIINIAHLEKYMPSDPKWGIQPKQSLNWHDFEVLEEVEVECIVNERMRKTKKGRKIQEFKVRFVGFGPEDDKWLTKTKLRNAPDILKDWDRKQRRLKNKLLV